MVVRHRDRARGPGKKNVHTGTHGADMPAPPLPCEWTARILRAYFMGEEPRACDARAIQTAACLSAAWRADAAPRELACYIAQGRAPAWAYPILRWDPRVRLYAAGNQISTYEMLTKLEAHYARRLPSHVSLQAVTRRLDRELRHAAHQRACGRYAGLNHWSPCCTAAQLLELARRAHAAYADGAV